MFIFIFIFSLIKSQSLIFQKFSYFDAASGSSDLYTDLKYGNKNENENENADENEDEDESEELEELKIEIQTDIRL